MSLLRSDNYATSSDLDACDQLDFTGRHESAVGDGGPTVINMPPRATRIAVAGHVCVDVRVRPFVEFPARGQLVETERIDAAVGGAVGNIGRALGPLGEPAYAVCRVGDDAWGDLIEANLSAWADTRFVTRSTSSPTSGTVVFVAPDGERSFIHTKGANVEFSSEHLPIEVLAELGVEHLHLGYALLLPGLDGDPMASALREATELGMTTSLDLTWDSTSRWMDAIGPLLPYVDVFCPNNDEATALTGHIDPAAAARSLIDHGVRRLAVVTCGAEGSVACRRDGSVIVTPSVEREVVDATGAGDAFNGGLITGLVRGLDDASAIRLAAQAAADALSASG